MREEAAQHLQDSRILSGDSVFSTELTGSHLLLLQGNDTIDFLQRLSTNDMAPLVQGRTVETLFTNEKGRVVDGAVVVPFLNGGVLLIVHRDAAGLEQWLERFIIMEDITVKRIAPIFHRLFWNDAANELQTEVNENQVVALEGWPGVTIGHYLQLKHPGKEPAIYMVAGDMDDFAAFRIEYKIPWFGYEVTSETNPLEAGVGHFVSFSKGCYVGQEVIARLDTYKKLRRTLVRFRFDEAPTSLPAPIYCGSDLVGHLCTVSRKKADAGLGLLQVSVLQASHLYFKQESKIISVTVE